MCSCIPYVTNFTSHMGACWMRSFCSAQLQQQDQLIPNCELSGQYAMTHTLIILDHVY